MLIFALAQGISAKELDSEAMDYRRKEIQEEFLKIPVPDKYNDMNLSVRVLGTNAGIASANALSTSHLLGGEKLAMAVEKAVGGGLNGHILNFLETNKVGGRLVAKWFNRDFQTGRCDMERIKDWGLYNASEFDKELAAKSARGMAMLEDAGEDLIGNTFVLVNEINYVDKSERSKNWGAALSVLGSIAEAYTGIDYLSEAGTLTGAMITTIKGFRVKIRTRLYQLEWNDSIAMDFYRNYYQAYDDEAGAKKFDAAKGKYTLKYIGDVTSSGQKSSFLGISEERPDLMIRKACQRALDENVADLQKKYEQFKIKAPIVSVEPDIKVQIGLKEGISEDSKFEVLEAQEKDGRVVYKRVGTVRPVKGKIWDNRFMAMEEQAYGADFGATTFKKESGGDFYPGLLIREIK